MKVFNTLRCLFLAGLLTVSGAAVSAQNVTVKGKVTDSRGEPVIGATVMLSSNQTVGTQTDLSGNYAISVPSSASLIYSCVGYATQTIAVAGRSVIDIVLAEDTEFLEETRGDRRHRLWRPAQERRYGRDRVREGVRPREPHGNRCRPGAPGQGRRRPDRERIRCAGRRLVHPDPRLFLELQDLSAHDRGRPQGQ